MPGAVEEESPPEGIHHWQKGSDIPQDLKKYWGQRHKFFSQYDDGIWMTDTAWYGVTPEPIANKIAAHVAEAASEDKTYIVDAFAGVGANSIAFAKSGRWSTVFAIEKDPKAIACGKHNAEIYGVKNILWIEGDCFKEIPKRFGGGNQPKTLIFASPPWGGPGYTEDEVFNLSTMQPYSIDFIHSRLMKFCKAMVLYLPRNSDLNQIAKFASEGQKIEVAHYCIRRASKALCVYLGDFTFPE